MADRLYADPQSMDDFGYRLEGARSDFDVLGAGAAAFPGPESRVDNASVDGALHDFGQKSGRSLQAVDSYFTALAKMCHRSAEVLRQADAALARQVPHHGHLDDF